MQDREIALQLRSTVKKDGTLELSLAEVEIPQPAEDEVVVRMEASPINPSDLGLLLGPADLSTARASGAANRPVVTASIPVDLMPSLAARLDQPLPVGNEGAGVVVQAGSSEAARALLGRTVAVFGGAMYSQVRAIKAHQCLVLPEGTAPAEGASCFVNPLTVLAMVETLRHEGHTALVHTAAASNLGQMLQKVCRDDDIALVNIVRKREQEEVLRAIGAVHVCDSSSPTFTKDLTEALVATKATLAFDAIGGGRLAGQILTCMERAASRTATQYSPYGSTVHKQVYVYGALDRGPIELVRSFGMAWGVGGWLLRDRLQRMGPEAAGALRARVAAELKTTFASHYSKEISLVEALDLDEIASYARMATGEKVLINPNKGS